MNPLTDNGASPCPQDISGYYGFPLLLPEPALQVLPSLAEAMGLENAIVTQQLHFLLRNPNSGRIIQGEKWIFNTYEQWREVFPFWTERAIRRIFNELEKNHIVESCQPEGALSRRKYYRINHGMLHRMYTGKLLRPCADFGHIERPNLALPLTETSCDTSLSKGSSLNRDAEFREARKKRLLDRIKPPRQFPSELEFNEFIESEDLHGIAQYRDNVYETLNNQKWRDWTGRAWIPIRDWKSYLRAFNDKLNRE